LNFTVGVISILTIKTIQKLGQYVIKGNADEANVVTTYVFHIHMNMAADIPLTIRNTRMNKGSAIRQLPRYAMKLSITQI
jgi:hypothetical protein